MQTRLTLKPGQKGTKKLVERYGDRLICVRYRYDPERKKRYKTVELIEEEVEWVEKSPLPAAESKVSIRIELGEVKIREQVKRAGGRWIPEEKLWEMKYGMVKALGLTSRIVEIKSV